MMPKFQYIICLVISLITSSAWGQQFTDNPKKQEIKSILGNEKEMTGFGNIDFRVGEVVDQQALLLGAYGGVLINKYFMLGVGGYGLASESKFDGNNPESGVARELNLYGGYAGMLLGLKVASREIVHLSVPMIIGAGQIDVSDNNYFDLANGDNDFVLESTSFFVFEPSALLEINISHHFRIGFGAGYRMVRGSSLENLKDEDLSGFSGVLSLQVGKF